MQLQYLKYCFSTAQNVGIAEGIMPKAVIEPVPHMIQMLLCLFTWMEYDIAWIRKLIFTPNALQLKTSVQNALFNKLSQL